MKYQQPRSIKQNFTSFINKIFTLNSNWKNTDVEIVSLSGNNSPRAFEQYPWDAEKYPLVVLFAGTTSDAHWAIDSRIGNYWNILKIGSRPDDTIALSNDSMVAFGVKSIEYDMPLRSVDLALQYIGPYENDIIVQLWNASGGEPGTALASGSIAGKEFRTMEWATTSLYPIVTLDKDTDYFISVHTDGALGNSYNLMIDNNPNGDITPFIQFSTGVSGNWTSVQNKTIFARVNGPVYHRVGGGLDSDIRVFIESKDLATTQKIADLLFVYFHLTKHSNPQRKEKMGVQVNSTGMNYDFVSDLT
ncbi:MAG: choice-of-anchor R domain-containing protein, partial [Chloroflexota bacterium]|nr:choice-of-anchor R domain-containing protein [Chloroflexota bacterium]